MKTSKINILQVITGLGKGGAERVVLDLCRFADKERFEISVLSFGKKRDLLPLFLEHGVKVTFFDITSFYNFLYFFRFLRYTVQNKKVDIIHAHLFHAFILVCLIRPFLFKPKVVFTSHSNLGSKFREFLLYLLRPMRTIDIIFSEMQRKYYDRKNAIVIQNGIDIAAHEAPTFKHKIFTFLNIARLEAVKNHLGLLDIVADLKRQDTQLFKVQIVGEGHLRPMIEARIKELYLEETVELLGFRTDVPALCAQAHSFILPSHWEGLPIALLEAGASALPVIATPVGSVPAVINTSNGYLCTLAEFGSCMKKVMHEYPTAQQKGINLQQDIRRNFTASAMTSKHTELYRTLCAV